MDASFIGVGAVLSEGQYGLRRKHLTIHNKAILKLIRKRRQSFLESVSFINIYMEEGLLLLQIIG